MGLASKQVLRLPLALVLVVLSSVATLSQDRVARHELAERVRSLNEQLNQAQTPGQDTLGILRKRAALLTKLIESNPGEATALALSTDQASRLTAVWPEMASLIESQGEWQGSAAVFVEDNFEQRTSRTRVWIEAGEEQVELHFTQDPPPLVSGQNLKVRGVRLGKQMAAALTDVGPAPAAAFACGPIGEQKIAVLMLQFPGVPFPTSVVTASELQDVYFSNTKISLDGYWREASYGKTWASGDVFGPFTLGQDYDFVTQQTEGLQAAIEAADATVDFSVYNHLVLIWPAPGVSGWGGRGGVGCVTMNSPSKGPFMGTETFMGIGTRQPYDGMVGIAAHESGHNLGLHHADTLDFAPLALGPPGATAVYTEYGDHYSVMGSGLFHYNAPHKSLLGWLQGKGVMNVEAAGSFLLEPFETSTGGLKAIRVRRGPASDKWLWLEYRQPIGYDAGLSATGSEAFSGALIHYEDPDLTQYQRHSLLLDFTPNTPHDFSDAALAAGQTWSDPFSPLSIRVDNAGTSGLAVDVKYGTPCVTLDPTSRNHGAGAETGAITVSAPAGCNWTAASNSDWMTITAGQSGSGAGTVSYSLTPNTGIKARTGMIFIGWQTFTVTQATSFVNQPPSVDSATPASGAGLSQTFTYTVSDPNGTSVLRNFFVWFHPKTSSTGCLFLIRLDAQQVGFPRGDGSYSQFPMGSHFALQDSFCGVDASRMSIAPSDDALTVTVPVVFTSKLQGDLVHTVTLTNAAGAEPSFNIGTWTVPETPCPYSICPAGVAASKNATGGTIAVTTNSHCPWLASISDFWIKVKSDVSATGSGTVSYAIDSNINPFPRSGTITIAGQTFTVNQESASAAGLITASPTALDFCSVVVGASSSQSVTVTNEGSASVQVTAAISGSAAYSISPASFTINGGSSQRVDITFTPPNQNNGVPFTASATFNISNIVQTVPLTGIGGQSTPGGSESSSVFVPIVLSSAGLNSSFFTSEMALTNRGASTATLNYTYTAAIGSGSGAASDTLPAGQQRIVPDAISYLRSLGVPIPSSGGQGGTLRVTCSGVSLSDLAVTVRTATAVANGRAGLAYAGIPVSTALTESSYLCGLRQNATDRSNIALQNAGTEGDIVLGVTVYSGDPAHPLSQDLPNVNLGPGGFTQISGILQSNGLSLVNGFVRVSRVSGSSPYYAYAVINDNANSDGSFVPPLLESSIQNHPGQTLPVIVEASSFSSELVVTNLSASSTNTYHFAFVSDAIQSADNTANFDLTLNPREQLILPNLVQYLRDHGIAGIPPLGTAIVGALFATGDTGSLFMGARTSTPGGGGRFGLFYVAVPNGSASTSGAWVYGLQQNADNRSNLALVNTGETDGNPDTFNIELYDGATGVRVTTMPSISLNARGWKQIGGILSGNGISQGYAHVVRSSGSNSFIAYGVVNDGGQPGLRTGDGAFVASSP